MNTKQAADVDREILELPGHEHLFRIRDALNDKHAAVMVGSGFSMNADNGERLPNWAQLAEKIYRGINPGRASDPKVIGGAPTGTSSMLRLAEEFEALHGRAALDALIRKEVPDAGVVHPGHLHQSLLALDWVDVFTTNYDTLLERAYYDDQKLLVPKIKRRYQVVVTDEDIPFSRADGRPRIVKLHGSFSSYRPFIVTEEDYRTYPEEFAPFVNMVQQSLLENVFCLIGFSGDDPNFLLWTGWVRDRLGKMTPPIYLITANRISPGLRLILERRFVYPIQIAQLGQEQGKSEVDYRMAYGRVLEFLAEHHDPRPIEWGTGSGSGDEPKSPEELVAGVEKLRVIRSSYPGWIFPPANVLHVFRNNVAWLGRLFWAWKKDWAPKFSDLSKLSLVFELHWWARMESDKFLVDWAGDMEELLDSVTTLVSDEQAFFKGVAELPASQRHSIQYFREAWKGLALFLLTERRRSFDEDGFARLASKLRALKGPLNTEELRVAIIYQNAVGRLEAFDFDGATKVIECWSKEDGDPYWLVKKAALLAEQGSFKEALHVGLQGLKAIRLQIQEDGETPKLLSRELWAELMLEQCQSQVRLSDMISATSRKASTVDEAVDSDALPSDLRHQAYKKRFSGAIGNGVDESEGDISRDKKLNERIDHPWNIIQWFRHTLHLGAAVPADGIDATDATTEARLYRNLVDEVGLATGIGYTRVASVELIYAAEINARRNTSPTVYIGDILRCADMAVFKGPYIVLSKGALAYWADDFINAIFIKVHSALDKLISNSKSERKEPDEARIQFGLEMLARLFGRLSDADLRRKVLDDIAVWYIQPGLYKRPFTFEPFGKFVSRLIADSTDAELQRLSKQLLSLPVIFEEQRGTLGTHWRYWPEPARLLVERQIKLDPEFDWESIADDLITKAAAEKDDVYERYLFRLDFLLRQGCLGNATKLAFANLVWRDAPDSGVPNIPGFLPAVLVDWPAPPSIDVAQRLDKTISKETLATLDYQAAINYLNNLLYLVRHKNAPLKSFDLATSLKGAITWWEKFQKKLDEKTMRHAQIFEWEIVQPRYLARVLSYAIYRACLTAGEAERGLIARLSDELRKSEIQLQYKYPYLHLVDVVLGKATASECSTALQTLVFDDEKVTEIDSMAAVGECLLEEKLKLSFTSDVFLILVNAIKLRRMPHTLDALRAIKRIVGVNQDVIQDDQLRALTTTLALVESSMKYSISSQDTREYRDGVPDCRRVAAELAGSLGTRINASFAPKGVDQLFSGFLNDPFVVTRSAISGKA